MSICGHKSFCAAVIAAFFVLTAAGVGFCEQDADRQAKSLAAYIMGVISDLQGQMDEAVEHYKKSSQYSDQYATHLRLGTDYARLNRLGDAIAEFETVLKMDPDNVQARYFLALIYSSQRDYDKAAENYEKILQTYAKEQPQNAEIYGFLGQLYYAKKEYDKAVAQFETVLTFQPDNVDMMYTVGALYLETNDRAKAKAMFQKCVDYQPDHDGCLNSLGYMYAEDGQELDKAQNLIELALAADPKNGAYLDSLGWVYFKKGDYVKALEYLKQADEQIQDPTIHEHLGDVYFQLKDFSAAKKYWTLSLETLPGQAAVEQKLKQMP